VENSELSVRYCGLCVGEVADLGTVNVNDDEAGAEAEACCRRAKFSDCNRVKRSLKFSFSLVVASFFASSAATWSSS